MQSCKSEFCEWGMRDNLNRELSGWHQLKHWGIVTILDFVSKALCSNYPEISAPIYILDFGWSSWRPVHWCCVVVPILDIALKHWIEPLNWIVILEPHTLPPTYILQQDNPKVRWKPSDERLRGNAQSNWNANDMDLHDERSMKNLWKPLVWSDRYISSTSIFVSGYYYIKHGHW